MLKELFHKTILAFSLMHSMTNSILPSTKRPPVELYEIGYDGTWEQFCDRTKIDQDFPLYFEHDLKTIRLLICRFKENQLINNQALLAFASYKYCLAMRPRFDELLDEFVEKLSLKDEEKKRILLRPGPVNISECYQEALASFTRVCVGNRNPCFKLFRLILGRACNFGTWLTKQDILSRIEEICVGKYITDQIDWQAIFMTLNLRE